MNSAVNIQQKTPPGVLRALTEAEFEAILLEFSATEIADAFDATFAQGSTGTDWQEIVAGAATEILMGKGFPMLVAIISVASGMPREQVQNWGIFNLGLKLVRVFTLTFHDAPPMVVAQYAVHRMLEHAAQKSAVATGNTTKH